MSKSQERRIRAMVDEGLVKVIKETALMGTLNFEKLALAIQKYLKKEAEKIKIGLNKSAQEGIEIFIKSIIKD